MAKFAAAGYLQTGAFWNLCPRIRRAGLLVLIPAFLYPCLYLSEITAATLQGHTTGLPWLANTLIYFAGAYLGMGVTVDLYRYRPDFVMAVLLSIAAPFIGLEIFLSLFMSVNAVLRQGIFGLWLLTLGPVVLVESAAPVLIGLCPVIFVGLRSLRLPKR